MQEENENSGRRTPGSKFSATVSPEVSTNVLSI